MNTESAADEEGGKVGIEKKEEPMDPVEQTAPPEDPADEGFESTIEISPEAKQSGLSSFPGSSSTEAVLDSLSSKLLMIERDEWEAVRAENINLRSSLQQREVELRAANRFAVSLKEDLMLSQRLAHIRKMEKEELERRNKEAEKQLQAWTAPNSDIQGTAPKADETFKTIQTKHEEIRTKHRAINDNMSAVRCGLEEAEKNMRQALSKIEYRNEEIHQEFLEREKLFSKLKGQAEEMDGLVKQKKEMTEELSSVKNKVEHLQKIIDSKNEFITNLQMRLEEMGAQLEQENAKVKEYDLQRLNLNTTVYELRTKTLDLQLELEKVNRSAEEASQSFEAKTLRLETEISQKKDNVVELNAKIRSLEEENSKINKINQAYAVSIRNMEMDIATLKSERNDCQRQLKERKIMEQVLQAQNRVGGSGPVEQRRINESLGKDINAGSELRPNSRVNRNGNQSSLSNGKAALLHEEGVNPFYLDNPGEVAQECSKATKELTTGDDEKNRQRDDKNKKRKTRPDDDRVSKERRQTCGLCNDSAYGLMIFCPLCLKEYHSLCVKQNVPDASSGTGARGFVCPDCRNKRNIVVKRPDSGFHFPCLQNTMAPTVKTFQLVRD